MTVKELIIQLQKLDQKSLVVLSKDEEGNGFSPLADVDTGKYEADSTWGGELVETGGVKCIVLWPTN